MNHASSSTTFLVLDLKISKERIGFVNFVVLNIILLLIILKCDFILVLQRNFLVCCKGNLLEPYELKQTLYNPLWMLQYWISHFIYIPTNYLGHTGNIPQKPLLSPVSWYNCAIPPVFLSSPISFFISNNNSAKL